MLNGYTLQRESGSPRASPELTLQNKLLAPELISIPGAGTHKGVAFASYCFLLAARGSLMLHNLRDGVHYGLEKAFTAAAKLSYPHLFADLHLLRGI